MGQCSGMTPDIRRRICDSAVPGGPVTIGVVSEDAPVKGRIAAWEDRHRGAVVKGSLVALLLIAAMVSFLVLRGDASPEPCAMHQSGSQVYLVLHPRAGTDWERRDCARLAEGLSAQSEQGLFVVKAKSDYGLLVCSVRGALGEMDIYAKRRSAWTRAMCSFIKGPAGGTSTEVLRLTSPSLSPPVVYLVLRGPSAAIKFIAQRLLSRNSKKHRIAVVPKPNGQKACTLHRGPLSITIYSRSKRAAASVCHAPRLTNVF